MRNLLLWPLRIAAVVVAVAATACIIEEPPKSEPVKTEPAGEPTVRIERDEEGAFERLGERMDRGAEKLDERLEVGTERLGRAMQKAGANLQETAEEARARRLREEAERGTRDTEIEVHIER